MTDGLRDALQATVGATYSIERELGGGGMSRVFVARDVSLQRDVARALAYVYPANVTDKVGIVTYANSVNAVDGQWHAYRCHWKISSGYPSAANADGRITCWVDGASSLTSRTPHDEHRGLDAAESVL